MLMSTFLCANYCFNSEIKLALTPLAGQFHRLVGLVAVVADSLGVPLVVDLAGVVVVLLVVEYVLAAMVLVRLSQ